MSDELKESTELQNQTFLFPPKSNLKLDSSGTLCSYTQLPAQGKSLDSENRMPGFESWFGDLLVMGP